MFENTVTDGRPVCPICERELTPDQGKTSGAYTAPTGLWLIHHSCVEAVGQALQFKVSDHVRLLEG